MNISIILPHLNPRVLLTEKDCQTLFIDIHKASYLLGILPRKYYIFCLCQSKSGAGHGDIVTAQRGLDQATLTIT